MVELAQYLHAVGAHGALIMTEDPIVEELHKIREEMLVEYGGLEGLVEHLRKIQAEMPGRVVQLEPKPARYT
jgi:hypothetical protein